MNPRCWRKPSPSFTLYLTFNQVQYTIHSTILLVWKVQPLTITVQLTSYQKGSIAGGVSQDTMAKNNPDVSVTETPTYLCFFLVTAYEAQDRSKRLENLTKLIACLEKKSPESHENMVWNSRWRRRNSRSHSDAVSGAPGFCCHQ